MTLGPDNTVNLDHFGLLSGQAGKLEAETEIGEINIGGHDYVVVPDPVRVRLDVSRTVAGYALRLRFRCDLDGPCMRCLEPAFAAIEVDAREIDQAAGSDEEDPEGELTSPYVSGNVLDLGTWDRDALILALPDPILCRPDCPGLCPVCGERLAGADPEAHRHDSGIDPRWAALSRLDLG